MFYVKEMVLPSARGFIATKAQRHEGLFLRNNKGRADWIFINCVRMFGWLMSRLILGYSFLESGCVRQT